MIQETIPTAMNLDPGKLLRYTPEDGDAKNLTRYYTLPGSSCKMRSITSILGSTINKPGLNRWRENLIRGNLDPNTVAAESAETGTRLHATIEGLLKGYETTIDPDLEPAINAFFKWREKDPLDFIQSEVAVYQDVVPGVLSVAGTVDGLFRATGGAEDGSLIITDFKSSSSGIYAESILQVAAYACAMFDMGCHDHISARIVSFQKHKNTQEFTGDVNIATIPFDSLGAWAQAWDGTVTLYSALKMKVDYNEL